MSRYALIALMIGALMFAGCERDDSSEESADEQSEETSEEQGEQTGDSEEESPEESSDTEDAPAPRQEPFEEAHNPEEPIEADEFHAALLESVCLAYDQCRNEPFKAAMFNMMAQSAMMAARQQGQQQSSAEIEQMMRRLQMEGVQVPPRRACNQLFGRLFTDAGLDAESIREVVEAGNVTYSPRRAGHCVARFGQPFDLCEEHQELSGQPDPQQVMSAMSNHQRDLGSHFQVCRNVFQGQLEQGDDCRYAYECGGNLGCVLVDPEEETGECVDPAEMRQQGGMGAGGAMPGGMGGPSAPPGGGGMPGR